MEKIIYSGMPVPENFWMTNRLKGTFTIVESPDGERVFRTLGVNGNVSGEPENTGGKLSNRADILLGQIGYL